MAIPNQTPYNIFTANGISTVFPYEFYLLNSFDLTVSINGVELSSGFTISGIGNVDGGEVTFLTPPANGSVVLLERVVPTYRLTEYQDNGDLLAETVNKDFDRLWMAIQQAFIYLGLALTRPLLGGPFNAHGYRIENVGDPINPQDAATKKFVESAVAGSSGYADDLFKRTLRVPEGYVNQLPAVQTRKNSILGFNDVGNPAPIFSWTDTADLALRLASSDGTHLVGFGQATLAASIPLTLEYFGAVGDGVVDDTDAVRAAMLWVSSGSNRHLTSGIGTRYKISQSIVVDFAGNTGCSIYIKSPFLIADDTGRAFLFTNTRDSSFYMIARGGGVSSYGAPNLGDIANPDPVHLQEFCAFRGCRSCNYDIRGYNYKGRLFRTLIELPGEHKSSAASIVIVAGENGADSCGQAFYMQGTSFTGVMTKVIDNWSDFGSVWNEVEDISIIYAEIGNAKNNGLIAAGVGSMHAVVLNMGNEDPGSNIASLTFMKGVSGKQCRRIRILSCLAAGPYDGIVVNEDAMSSVDMGNYIHITTSNSRRYAMFLNNARDLKVIHHSNGDFIPLRYKGNSYGTNYEIHSATSRLQAIQIDSDALNGEFTGHVLSAGYGLTGSPVIACDSLSNNIRFNNMHVQTIESLNNAGAYKLAANNRVRINGGKIERDSQSTPIFVGNVYPYRAFDIVGFANRVGSASFIPAGQLFVDVLHGLNIRPTTIVITRSSGFTSFTDRVPLVTNDTTFRVQVDTAMSGDAYFYWDANALKS